MTLDEWRVEQEQKTPKGELGMFFWSDNELPQSSNSLAIETPVWVQKTFGKSQILVGLSLFWFMKLLHDPYMLVLGEKISDSFNLTLFTHVFLMEQHVLQLARPL